MPSDKLKEYVKDSRSQGYSQIEIANHLLDSGHHIDDVHGALEHAKTNRKQKHPSDKYFLWFALCGLAIFLIVGGIFASNLLDGLKNIKSNKDQLNASVEESTPSMRFDCGSDSTCFARMAASCTPARVLLFEKQDKSSTESVVIEVEQEIKGQVDNNCIFDLEYITFEARAGDKVVDYGFAGKSMSCTIPLDQANKYSEFLQGAQILESCSGTLVTYLSSGAARV